MCKQPKQLELWETKRSWSRFNRCVHVSEIIPRILSQVAQLAIVPSINNPLPITTMITIKTAEIAVFDAFKRIKQARKELAAANKEVEAAKDLISRWVEDNRKIVLADLPIGESVNIAGAGEIEIGSQHRVDMNRLRIDDPKLVEKYSDDFPVVKFNPA